MGFQKVQKQDTAHYVLETSDGDTDYHSL